MMRSIDDIKREYQTITSELTELYKFQEDCHERISILEDKLASLTELLDILELDSVIADSTKEEHLLVWKSDKLLINPASSAKAYFQLLSVSELLKAY